MTPAEIFATCLITVALGTVLLSEMSRPTKGTKPRMFIVGLFLLWFIYAQFIQ